MSNNPNESSRKVVEQFVQNAQQKVDSLHIFADILKKSWDILAFENTKKLLHIQQTDKAYNCIEEIIADDNLTYIGKALQDIYKKKINENHVPKNVEIHIFDNTKKVHTYQFSFLKQKKYYEDIRIGLLLAIMHGYQIRVMHEGIDMCSGYFLSLEKIAMNTLYNRIYSLLWEQRIHFQWLSQMLFSEEKVSTGLEKAKKELHNFLENIPQKEHENIKQQLYLEMFSRYIEKNKPKNMDFSYKKDIEKIFVKKRIHATIYSGKDLEDDNFAYTQIFWLSNIVQFVDLISKFSKSDEQNLWIIFSAEPLIKNFSLKKYL